MTLTTSQTVKLYAYEAGNKVEHYKTELTENEIASINPGLKRNEQFDLMFLKQEESSGESWFIKSTNYGPGT